MSKKWTMDSAKSYIAKVDSGHIPMGLTYWSAKDYILKMMQEKYTVKAHDNSRSNH